MVGQEWLAVLLAIAGYVLGSVPFGVLVSRLLGAADPRDAGSGNIGFTNVLRVSGKAAGLLTLLGDAGKGWLVGWLGAQSLTSEAAILVVAASPILGHLYSLFLRFRGGKGVATAMGAIAGMALPVGAAILGLWLVTVALSGRSSLGAVVAFAALPAVSLLLGRSWGFAAFTAAVSLVILARHKENLVRLWHGREPRMGQAD